MGLGFLALSTWHLALIYWLTLMIAVMDWETQLVSELLVVAWGIAVILSNLSSLGNLNHLLGALSAVLVIGGLWAVTRGRGMGFGDVEIAAVLGFWVGWPNIWLALMMSFVIGAGVGLVKIGFNRSKLKTEMAFGPFLILGGWLAFLWGDKLTKILYGF